MKYMLVHGEMNIADGEKFKLQVVVQMCVAATDNCPELKGVVLCLLRDYIALPMGGLTTAHLKQEVSEWYRVFLYGQAAQCSASSLPPGSIRCIVVELREDNRMSLLCASSAPTVTTERGQLPSAVSDFEMSNESAEATAVVASAMLALEEGGFAALDLRLAPVTAVEGYTARVQRGLVVGVFDYTGSVLWVRNPD